jgi:hypothetical protein
MAEARPEFGQAVTEALQRMGLGAETAGPILGLNARTLTAMAEGIVPMRSLVIRFAEAIGRQSERLPGAPQWWRDVDAWLDVAGYPPRREAGASGPAGSDGPPLPRPPPARPAPERTPPSPSAEGGPRAREFYRPVYERMVWGDTYVHIFWIVDADDRKAYRMNFAAGVDYRARASQVKQDLDNLSREQFDRKYGRFRFNGTNEK